MPRIKSRTIKITREIIDSAIPQNTSHCLLAEGIRKSIPDSYSVYVSGEFVKFNVGDHKKVTGTRYCYQLTSATSKKAEEFDTMEENGISRSHFKPFLFVLDGRHATSAKVVKAGPQSGLKRKKKATGYKRKVTEKRCSVRRYRGLAAYSSASA